MHNVHVIQVGNGCWKEATAGGFGNHPQTFEKTSKPLIDFKGPKQYLIGFDIICLCLDAEHLQKKSFGAYR